MNEENKYYTPQIEEFHVGFECEVKDNDKVHEWFPIMCTMSTPFDVDSSHYSARVKYLDREDIESLGWEHIQEIEFTDHTVYQFVREKYILSFEYPKRLICVFQRRDDRTVEHSFISICKNKSELKKLMQQLNIK